MHTDAVTTVEVVALGVCDNGVTRCTVEADCDVCGGDTRGTALGSAADGTACNLVDPLVVDSESGLTFSQPNLSAPKYTSQRIAGSGGSGLVATH